MDRRLHSSKLLYGINDICYRCYKSYDLNELFLYDDNFLCINCAISVVRSPSKLKDWEIKNDNEKQYICKRCHSLKSSKRFRMDEKFRMGNRYCAYCLLKKRWAERRKIRDLDSII